MKYFAVLFMTVLMSCLSFAEANFDISKLVGEYKLKECSDGASLNSVYNSYVITQTGADALHFEMTYGENNYQARTTISGIDGKTEVSMDVEDVTRILETSKASTISNGVRITNTEAQFFSILFVPIHYSASSETYRLENDQLVVRSKYFAILMGHRMPKTVICRYDRIK